MKPIIVTITTNVLKTHMTIDFTRLVLATEYLGTGYKISKNEIL